MRLTKFDVYQVKRRPTGLQAFALAAAKEKADKAAKAGEEAKARAEAKASGHSLEHIAKAKRLGMTPDKLLVLQAGVELKQRARAVRHKAEKAKWQRVYGQGIDIKTPLIFIKRAIDRLPEQLGNVPGVNKLALVDTLTPLNVVLHAAATTLLAPFVGPAPSLATGFDNPDKAKRWGDKFLLDKGAKVTGQVKTSIKEFLLALAAGKDWPKIDKLVATNKDFARLIPTLEDECTSRLFGGPGYSNNFLKRTTKAKDPPLVEPKGAVAKAGALTGPIPLKAKSPFSHQPALKPKARDKIKRQAGKDRKRELRKELKARQAQIQAKRSDLSDDNGFPANEPKRKKRRRPKSKPKVVNVDSSSEELGPPRKLTKPKGSSSKPRALGEKAKLGGGKAKAGGSGFCKPKTRKAADIHQDLAHFFD